MKIALFVVRNFLACHYSLFGYRETLERMGHQVSEFAFPHNNPQDVIAVQRARQEMPRIEQLMEYDLILSTYQEYVHPWLEMVYAPPNWSFTYPPEDWKQLMKKVPVIARFDESMDRADLALPQRVPMLMNWATHHSFPAAQDAKKFGGDWLPYGADTTVFHPDREGKSMWRKPGPVKVFEVGFLGTFYPKRDAYLNKLIMHVGKGTTFYRGNVMIQDVLGMRERETTDLLAENYRNFGIFFCLPPNSSLFVEKIFDVMACDTMVMYPRFFDPAQEENMSIFKDGEHIVYYDLGFYADNGKQVKHYLAHPEEVERIARAGGELVRSKYTLQIMLEKMLVHVAKPIVS